MDESFLMWVFLPFFASSFPSEPNDESPANVDAAVSWVHLE